MAHSTALNVFVGLKLYSSAEYFQLPNVWDSNDLNIGTTWLMDY